MPSTFGLFKDAYPKKQLADAHQTLKQLGDSGVTKQYVQLAGVLSTENYTPLSSKNLYLKLADYIQQAEAFTSQNKINPESPLPSSMHR